MKNYSITFVDLPIVIIKEYLSMVWEYLDLPVGSKYLAKD